jgi:hypothetical protein
LTRKHTSMIAQKQSTVCQVLAAQSSRHRLIALNSSCAPPKLMLSVTVQLPARLSHPILDQLIVEALSEADIGSIGIPVTQLAMRAQSLVAIIADQ